MSKEPAQLIPHTCCLLIHSLNNYLVMAGDALKSGSALGVQGAAVSDAHKIPCQQALNDGTLA